MGLMTSRGRKSLRAKTLAARLPTRQPRSDLPSLTTHGVSSGGHRLRQTTATRRRAMRLMNLAGSTASANADSTGTGDPVTHAAST